MVAERTSLVLLFQLLHRAPACREGALHVLYALAGTPELAWAAAKHGGVVYILELLLPLQGKVLYSHFNCSFQSSMLLKKLYQITEVLCKGTSNFQLANSISQ